MNLYLRLLWTLLSAQALGPVPWSGTTMHRFRVLPHDLDAFGHMNNGRYLQIMDVARTGWMIRTGIAAVIRRNGWTPILGGSVMRFRYALGFLQAFQVRTRLIAWDGRWFYLEHAFYDGRERCVSMGLARAAMRGDHGWLPTSAMVAEIEAGAVSPPLPAHVRQWAAVEDAMLRHGRRPGDPALANGPAAERS